MPFGEARTLGFNNQFLARLLVANSIINRNGVFFYNGTPGSGNLIASIIADHVPPIITADTFGNPVISGVTEYNPGLQAVSFHFGIISYYTWFSGTWNLVGTSGFSAIGTLNRKGGVFANPDGSFTIVPTGDTTGASDIGNINSALSHASQPNKVYLAPGVFSINAPITPPTNSSLLGAGAGVTVINQVASAQEGLNATNVSTVTLRGFTLVGNGSGVSTKAGIHFVSNPPTANHILDDIIVQNFGLQGFIFDSVFLTELRKCESLQNGGIGFQVTNSFAVPTSFTFHTCYANGNGGNGYEFDGLQYSALSGCAADGNPTGYALFGCQGVTLTGCGTEVFTATGFLFNNCKGCGLYSGFTFNGKTKVVWVTNGSSRQTVGGLTETSPAAGATACLQVDAGTTCIAWGITHVTADSLAAGTTTNVDGSA